MRFKRRDLLLFGGFLFSAAVLNGSSETGKLSGNQETAVAILFERFETVFRIHPSLLTDTRRSNTRGFVQEPFGYLMLALDQKNRHLRPLVLDSGEAVLLGTKDYSPPEGLGRVVSTRCYITVLQNGRNPRYVANALGEPTGKTKAGNPYWKWSAELEEFGERSTLLSSLYATQVGESFFVVTNSLAELQSVSDEFSSPGSHRLSLDHVRGLENIVERKFWTYRRYGDARLRSQPSIFNGLKGVADDAEALTLYVDLDRNIGVLDLISANSNDSTARQFRDVLSMPEPRPIGNREWEITFLISDDDPHDTSWKVLWLFGLGVVV